MRADVDNDHSSSKGHSLEILSSFGVVSGHFWDTALCSQHAGLKDLVGLDSEWAAANLVSGRSVLRVRGVVDGNVLAIAPGTVPQKVDYQYSHKVASTDPEDKYEIAAIIEERTLSGRKEYLVRWPAGDVSWEARADLLELFGAASVGRRVRLQE